MTGNSHDLGAWDLPHLDTGRCLVRFTRGLLAAEDDTLAALTAGRRAAAPVFVDEGVAAARPELLDAVAARGLAPRVVPGGHAIRHGAAAEAEIAAAVGAVGGSVVAVGGAATLESVDRAVAAAGRAVPQIRVPTTVHGLVAALGPGAHAVVCDFELLRSLSDEAWRAGIAPAIEAALCADRAFFWWLERQTEELRWRSLPAMAWVMYRTAELHLAGGHQPLGVPVRRGGARRGEAAALGIALGVTCAHRSGRLPCLEWRRILELLERLELPTWDPLLAAAPEAVTCGMLERIGAGIRAEPVDPSALLAAADALRERPRTSQARART